MPLSFPTAVGAGLLMGLPFGYALDSSGMSDPKILHDQFEIISNKEEGDYRMVKTFLGAVGTGAVSIGVMRQLGLVSALSCKPLHPLANAIGGTILGAGIYYSGACPGTVFAQIGSDPEPNGTEHGLYTLLGGLCGTMFYGLVEPSIKKSGILSGSGNKDSLITMMFGNNTYDGVVLIPFGLSILGLNYAINKYFPDKKTNNEQTEEQQKQSLLYSYQSVMIGLLQIPAFLIVNKYVSTSSAYCTVNGHILNAIPAIKNNMNLAYFNCNMTKSVCYWQVWLNVGVVAGAYISAYIKRQASKTSKNQSNKQKMSNIKKVKAILGGFALLFGARMADGCTSGHGLSGIAQLAPSSLITSVFMFAGGLGMSAIKHNYLK